jgi:hypothetical protein
MWESSFLLYIQHVSPGQEMHEIYTSVKNDLHQLRHALITYISFAHTCKYIARTIYLKYTRQKYLLAACMDVDQSGTMERIRPTTTNKPGM